MPDPRIPSPDGQPHHAAGPAHIPDRLSELMDLLSHALRGVCRADLGLANWFDRMEGLR